MINSLEIQKLKVHLTVTNIALHAIYSALSTTQRDIALTIFRTTTENAQATLQKEGAAQNAINFYAELCTSTENVLRGHRYP